MSHLYKTSFNSEHTDTHLHKCLQSETHSHTLIHREQLNNSCRAKSDYLVPHFPFSLVFSFYFFRLYHKKGVLHLYRASLLKWMFIRLKCLFLISTALLLLSQREQKKKEREILVLYINTQYDWTLLRMWEHVKHSVSV